jgi:5-hydroxyisourate hydrolase
VSVLSTHVLDTTRGVPAVGVAVSLWSDEAAASVASLVTDGDGRASFGDIPAGVYELRFAVGAYFGSAEFLDVVPVRFAVGDGPKYHVPLLVSPWAYSTYRGS